MPNSLMSNRDQLAPPGSGNMTRTPNRTRYRVSFNAPLRLQLCVRLHLHTLAPLRFLPIAPLHVRQAGVRQQLLPEQGGDAVR